MRQRHQNPFSFLPTFTIFDSVTVTITKILLLMWKRGERELVCLLVLLLYRPCTPVLHCTVLLYNP